MTRSGPGFAALLLLCACAQTPDVSPLEEPSAPPEPVTRISETPPLAFEGSRQEIRARRPLARIDRTAPVDDVWERIRLGFGMADLDDPLVAEKMASYMARPDYLQRMFERSRLYLFHVVEELEKRGMPTELALLPMVESAYNPMAYSRAHASGLWQFIPGTGKRFELEQNWWYDARRDIVESTNAALDYLAKLYEMHGDWHLALASYNWGENAVGRAITKNEAAGLPGDYASLVMPPETRHYVPKLQALKNIIANPGALGVELAPIPNQPYFATVAKNRDIDVQLAARLAEMPVADFMALNPGFSRPIIRASVSPRIVLPADKVDVFHDNLEALGKKSLVTWKTYQPGKGENFESIAKKHGMTVGYLKEVNGIPPRQRAVPRLLVVPTNPTAAAKLPIMYAPPIPVATRRIFHTVKKGETLTSIAAVHKVSVEDLKRWNGVSQAVA
ncbi:MAG TPA: transglycosylase SLT domain-containing protein, partial [Burkholderiales bacterium]|nr:transglycosylase SLT domain-containing protein [Burkholderiales bacterium]